MTIYYFTVEMRIHLLLYFISLAHWIMYSVIETFLGWGFHEMATFLHDKDDHHSEV